MDRAGFSPSTNGGMPPGPTRPRRVAGSVRAATAAVCAPLSLLFGWASIALPNAWGSPVTWLLLLLALAHAGVVGCAALAHETLSRARRWLALVSFASAGLLSLALFVTGAVLVERYAALGWGLSVLLALIEVLVLISTVVVGLWALPRAEPADA